jgi:hypothetical protein
LQIDIGSLTYRAFFSIRFQLSIIAFTLIFGYCSGCFVSLIAPCAAQLGLTSTAGTRLGMMFGIMSIGGVSGVAGMMIFTKND